MTDTAALIPNSEDCFRLTFEEAGSGMALLTLDGCWFRANQALCRILGYDERELREMTFDEITHPSDVPQSWDQARRLLRGESRGEEMEKRYLHCDGHMVWVRRTLSLIRDGRGKPLHFFAHIEDITERVRAQEALRQSEERFRLLAASAPIGIFLVDPAGSVVYVNPKCQEFTGLSADDQLGEEWKKSLPPDDRETLPAWAEAVRNGTRFHRDIRLLAPGGSRWVQATMVPVRNDAGTVTGYVGTSVNISELKALQQQLTDKNAALEAETERAREASRHKSHFLANMSHELRTPLNGIIGFSELLHDEKAGPLSPEQVEFTDIVLQSSQHLLRLINDLLDMAKIEAGREELAVEPFALRDVVAEVSSSLHPLVKRQDIYLFTSIELEDDRVELDRQKIKQILYNLLSNAIKFTPGRGIIHLHAVPCGEGFHLLVQDTGPGIAPSDLSRLFVEFEQLQPQTNCQHQGTGLGLALTKKLVELHGGTIAVESRIGEGTVFTVTLPRRARNLQIP